MEPPKTGTGPDIDTVDPAWHYEYSLLPIDAAVRRAEIETAQAAKITSLVEAARKWRQCGVSDRFFDPVAALIDAVDALDREGADDHATP